MAGMLDDALNALQPGNPGVAQIAPTQPQSGLLAQQPPGQLTPDMMTALQQLMAQRQQEQSPVTQFGNWMQQAAQADPTDTRLGQMAQVFRDPNALKDTKGMTDYMNILKSGGWGQGDMSNRAYNMSLNRES